MNQRTYPDEGLCYSDTKKEFEDFFKTGEILKTFEDEEKGNPPEMERVIEDPNKRYKAVVRYAKKHAAQIYTMVDGDDGEIYYSKGIRFCNRINQGLYIVAKIEGAKVDNS